MTSPELPAATRAWVAAAIGSGAEIAAARPQSGATSSTLHRLDILYHGRQLHLMLRRFTHENWLAEEPDLAAHEAASLQQARAAGLPTPELVAYDLDGSQAGVPAVLMTRLGGSVDLHPADFADWLVQQAAVLQPLHAVASAGFPWRYAPYNDLNRLMPPAWSIYPTLWERAIEIVNGPPPPAAERFIHRDYHPVNVLWQGKRLSGVVDWANACRGPAGIDVAWCRANLASLYGVPVAERFLRFYRSLAGARGEDHPYWDLMALIEVLPGPPEVYPPWREYGVHGLTGPLLQARQDAFLASVMAELGGNAGS